MENCKSIELLVGMLFTGNKYCYQGRVEVMDIDFENNVLKVNLTSDCKTFYSNWTEEWNLQHTIWGFERGDYFFNSEWKGFPPTIN